MRKLSLVLFICLLASAGSLYAACKTEACQLAVAWKNDYTAIVLADDISREEYLAVLDAVAANRGAVGIEAERVLLGWVPRPAAARLRAVRGVKSVVYDAVGRPGDVVKNAQAREALGFFNRVLSGEYEDIVEIGLAKPSDPLAGCIRQRSPDASQLQIFSSGITGDAGEQPDELGAHVEEPDHAHAFESPQRPDDVTSYFWFRTPYQNPNMRGRITVQLFRMESDGTVDPNLYTWNTTDFQYAHDQVWGAFNFWANEAYNRGVTLSFRVKTVDILSRYTRNFVPTGTRYEPISRPASQDYLWMNDALSKYGYGASPVTAENVYTRNDQFNAYWRNDPTYGNFDGSFTVYVVYNPVGVAPATFADGYRAYAFYDGPHTTVMWNSGGWGPANMGRVLTHEAGHIFWACDEYYDAPSNTGCFTCSNCLFNVGPRNQQQTPWILNANCDHPTATGCDISRVSCMMKDLSPGLCAHTPGQVGW